MMVSNKTSWGLCVYYWNINQVGHLLTCLSKSSSRLTVGNMTTTAKTLKAIRDADALGRMLALMESKNCIPQLPVNAAGCLTAIAEKSGMSLVLPLGTASLLFPD